MEKNLYIHLIRKEAKHVRKGCVYNLYAAGSSRGWETYAVVAALAFMVVHALMSCFAGRGGTSQLQPDGVPTQTKQQGSSGHQPFGV